MKSKLKFIIIYLFRNHCVVFDAVCVDVKEVGLANTYNDRVFMLQIRQRKKYAIESCFPADFNQVNPAVIVLKLAGLRPQMSL